MLTPTTNDPYFADVPWDVVTDDCGNVIGEVYLIFPEPLDQIDYFSE